MKKYNIKRNDTVPIRIEYKLDDVAVDLQGFTPMLVCKAKLSDTSYRFQKTGDIVAPSTLGYADVTLTSTDTGTTMKNGICEAILVDGGGNNYTYGQFLLDIDPDVYTG